MPAQAVLQIGLVGTTHWLPQHVVPVGHACEGEGSKRMVYSVSFQMFSFQTKKISKTNSLPPKQMVIVFGFTQATAWSGKL
jgi:hypothetical protein